jgi:hypothetical protein
VSPLERSFLTGKEISIRDKDGIIKIKGDQNGH